MCEWKVCGSASGRSCSNATSASTSRRRLKAPESEWTAGSEIERGAVSLAMYAGSAGRHTSGTSALQGTEACLFRSTRVSREDSARREIQRSDSTGHMSKPACV